MIMCHHPDSGLLDKRLYPSGICGLMQDTWQGMLKAERATWGFLKRSVLWFPERPWRTAPGTFVPLLLEAGCGTHSCTKLSFSSQVSGYGSLGWGRTSSSLCNVLCDAHTKR